MKQHQRVMAKANNIKLKETEAVVVGPETTTSTGQQTIRIQNQSIVTTAAGPGGTQSNFILVRAARSDSGQLILQNGHELLTLLNESAAAAAAAAAGEDNNKPIVIQQRSIKGRGSGSNSGSNINESTNSIAVHHQSHPSTRGDTSGGSGSQTILLQSSTGGMKKLTSADGSSIILQQARLATTKSGSSDNNSGPILLQTLKRLDKTPSILVIRNAGGSTTASTSKMVSAQVKTIPRLAQQQQHQQQQQETVTVITSEGRERSVERVSNSKQTNIPLGSGKCKYFTFIFLFLYISSQKITLHKKWVVKR